MCRPAVRRAVGALALSLLASTEVISSAGLRDGEGSKVIIQFDRPENNNLDAGAFLLRGNNKGVEVEAPPARGRSFKGGNKQVADAADPTNKAADMDGPPASFAYYKGGSKDINDVIDPQAPPAFEAAVDFNKQVVDDGDGPPAWRKMQVVEPAFTTTSFGFYKGGSKEIIDVVDPQPPTFEAAVESNKQVVVNDGDGPSAWRKMQTVESAFPPTSFGFYEGGSKEIVDTSEPSDAADPNKQVVEPASPPTSSGLYKGGNKPVAEPDDLLASLGPFKGGSKMIIDVVDLHAPPALEAVAMVSNKQVVVNDGDGPPAWRKMQVVEPASPPTSFGFYESGNKQVADADDPNKATNVEAHPPANSFELLRGGRKQVVVDAVDVEASPTRMGPFRGGHKQAADVDGPPTSFGFLKGGSEAVVVDDVIAYQEPQPNSSP